MERSDVRCKCEDCGKHFRKGEEGDNERFCLRCERQSLTRDMDEIDYEDFDRIEIEQE